jgi:TAG lipase/steryl ester hydrolase/phospholipase A2/LPA acyltransferase
VTLANSYDDWRSNAIAEDENSGSLEWKNSDETGRYDYRVIRRRYNELVEIRASGDPLRLLYYLNEGIHGNMGGMGATKLYTRAQFGTKTLVENYVAELVSALNHLKGEDSGSIPQAQKTAYFRRARLCFGRSALMLSGARALGAFHLGVVKSMIEQNILPQVISGAGSGSFVAALIGTRTKEDLTTFLNSSDISDVLKFEATEYSQRRIDLHDLENLLVKIIPDMTFSEAFETSGFHINISVAPKEAQQRSRLLNSITAPNALIRESIIASCALPGVFPSVKLMAKDNNGKRQPYVPSRSWIDGSITDELPTKRLARLYGVNHFISSQANPLLLRNKGSSLGDESLVSRWVNIYQSASRQWLRVLFPFAMEAIKEAYPLNALARNWFSTAIQENSADINILPTARYLRASMFYDSLANNESAELITDGERATWPLIERIRINTAVSRCIDDILNSLDEDFL